MRTSFLTIIATLLVLSYIPHANAQTSFNRTLKIGSYGTDVRELQKVLNSDYSTRILGNGPGSPGNETLYFGSLTQNAVVRFQEKYAKQILIPNNLNAGTGIVGPSTRATLIAMSDSPPIVPPPPVSIVQPVSPIPVATPMPSPSPVATVTKTAYTNPNLKNLDKFLAAIDKVAVKQGYSVSKIANMKKVAIERLSTTTDIRANFLKIVQSKSHQSAQNSSVVSKMLATIEQTFGEFFTPQHAYAQEEAATVPFGGALLVVFPCDGPVFNLTIEPLPPSYAALLSYTDGSQAFLSYNIPFTEWLLGEYEPAVNEECWIGDVPYPSEGMITPMTGSSPL